MPVSGDLPTNDQRNTYAPGQKTTVSPNIPFSLDLLPTTSEDIKQYIAKRPYTQKIGDEEVTYSIIPKKQSTFIMTHDRFLILKSI